MSLNDTMTVILFHGLTHRHQQRVWEQVTAQSGVSGSHRTGRVCPNGLRTQSAALNARESGVMSVCVAHGRDEQRTSICRHSQRTPLQT